MLALLTGEQKPPPCSQRRPARNIPRVADRQCVKEAHPVKVKMSISNRALRPGRISSPIGFWSAFLIVITFLVFTICFVVIVSTPPRFTWTNLADYLLFATGRSQILQHVARFAMLLFGPLYVVLLNCIYKHTPPEKRVLARIGADFGLAFAVLTGINYFVQLSVVRLSMLKGELHGLEQIVQANPVSGISAITMLGGTVFPGLSALFIAPVFSGGKLEKAIGAIHIPDGTQWIIAAE